MKSESAYSIADAVRNLHRLDASYWRALVSNGYPNVQVVSAPSTPAAKEIRSTDLRHVMTFARMQYDWTVADLGRNLDPSSLSTLESIDEAYLVTTSELPALHQAKQVVRLLVESGYSREKIHLVMNRTPRHLDVTIDELENMLGVPVVATIPEDHEGLHESLVEGKLVSSSSNLGKHYARLTRKIAGVREDSRKKKFSLFG